MHMRAVLIFNAVLSAVHGIGFVLAHGFLLKLYQVARTPGGSLMGHLMKASVQ